MAIYKGSRYEFSTIDFVATDSALHEKSLVLYKFSNLGMITFWEHVYTEGERLDQIAFKYYKRPEYWWVIPEYNPSITDFTEIVPGTVLRIPNV